MQNTEIRRFDMNWKSKLAQVVHSALDLVLQLNHQKGLINNYKIRAFFHNIFAELQDSNPNRTAGKKKKMKPSIHGIEHYL